MLAALALTGCETTQERSAKLERTALRVAAQKHHAEQVLDVTEPSAVIKVVSSAVVHNSEGTAVAVLLRNDSATAQREVPLAVKVLAADGATLYTNETPGLSTSLRRVALIPAHGQATWVDDQVQTTGTPSSASAEAGEGTRAGAAPQIVLSGQRLGEEAGGIGVVTGTVANHSTIAQHELLIDATASAGGRVLAAGRALITSLAPGASSSFQIFLIGSAPKGATLTVSAPPTTFG